MKFVTFILPASLALCSAAQEVKPIRVPQFSTTVISRATTLTPCTTAPLESVDTTTSTPTAPTLPPPTSPSLPSTSSTPIKTNNSLDPYTRCATHPDKTQRTLLDTVALNRTYTYKATRQIDVYVHIVTTDSHRSSYTPQMISDQITVLNDAYASTGFSFTLQGSDFTVQPAWAHASAGSPAELDMKSALHMGSYADLNLYFLSHLGSGLLGFCYFPTSDPEPATRVLDGCSALAASMPGGEAENYNLGLTAVHEVGHWFGLYHVFDSSSSFESSSSSSSSSSSPACSGPGDFVSDTPVQSEATFGCPSRPGRGVAAGHPDSCPDQEGWDSIHNYMDYSYDQCLYEFTDGQAQRARALFDEYRAGK